MDGVGDEVEAEVEEVEEEVEVVWRVTWVPRGSLVQFALPYKKFRIRGSGATFAALITPGQGNIPATARPGLILIGAGRATSAVMNEQLAI